MNNLTSFKTGSEPKDTHVIVNDDLFETLQMAVVVAGSVFSLCGVVTNTINIKTFIAVGTDDAVVVSLLALAISDVLYTAASFLASCGLLFIQIELEYRVIFPISPFAFMLFASNVAIPMYSITEMTTTFIAVVRCLCVARPLHFKNMITRSRSTTIHTFFAVFAIAWYAPIFSQMGMRRAFDVTVNKTRVVLWVSDIREDIKDTVFLFFNTILSFTSQVIMIFCLVVMANALKRSFKFRQTSGAKTTDNDKTPSNSLSGKELQVVQQVVLISTIYILCTIPKLLSALYSFIEPEFDVGKREHNFYFVVAYTSRMFENFNSSSTLFVYYAYNSKYRSKFLKKQEHK